MFSARVARRHRCRALAGFTGPLEAEAYPSRTIKIVVPYPAGGITDAPPRTTQERLTPQKSGQPIVVENKPGAAGNLGAEQVFNAEPDGYTIMVKLRPRRSPSTRASMPSSDGRFVPVTIMVTIHLAVHQPCEDQGQDVAEFIAYAKENPGQGHGGDARQRLDLAPHV